REWNIRAVGSPEARWAWSVALEPRPDRRPPEARADAGRMKPVLSPPPRAVVHVVADRLRREAERLGELGNGHEFAHWSRDGWRPIRLERAASAETAAAVAPKAF